MHSSIISSRDLSPVWMPRYRFWNNITDGINARTGKVLGDRPYSRWKIALAVTVALFVVAGIIFVVRLNQQASKSLV